MYPDDFLPRRRLDGQLPIGVIHVILKQLARANRRTCTGTTAPGSELDYPCTQSCRL